MKLSEKELRKRDARRDIGAEVLQAVRQIKAGKGRRFAVKVPPIVAMRQKAKLSHTARAGVQGRRRAYSAIARPIRNPCSLSTGK
jgi:putative transcriptional regulator